MNVGYGRCLKEIDVSLNKDFQVHATDGDTNSSEENYLQLCQVKSGLHL